MGYDFTHSREVKNSRQQYNCIWCGEKTTHFRIYQVGSSSGDFWDCHYHQECYQALRDTDEGFEDGIPEFAHKRGSTEYKDNY